MDYNEKQQLILSKAEELFSAKGYDGTSVRDIAEEAGVNIAMISYYFGSKEKLMEALFTNRTIHVKLKIERLLQDETLSPVQKMETLIDDYINKAIEKQRFFKIMLCEQMINQNKAIIDLVYDLRKKNNEEIARLIKDGQEKGVFRKNVDVLLLMGTLIGCVTQMMLTLNYYKEVHGMENLPEEEFHRQVRLNLSNHIKFLFKALLTYEA